MKPTYYSWLRAAALSLVSISAAHAQVKFINSTADSDYSTSTNWSSGFVPTGADQAFIGDATNTPRSVVYSSNADQTTTGRFIIGYGATGSLTMKAGSGTLQFGGNDFGLANYVGVGGGTGALTIEGGTLKIDNGLATGGASLAIGTNDSGSNGTVNVSGGLVDIVGGRLQVGLNNNGSTSVINLSGTGVINVGVASTYVERGWFRIGQGTNTVNLDGGILALKLIDTGSANGLRSNVYFNGTTIKSLASAIDFIQGNSANTNVAGANFQMKNGGLIFDTNTFDVTIADAIRQAAGDTGQLTKTGDGTLTLKAAMGWTGGTTVNQGTLKFGSNDVFGDASSIGGSLTAKSGTTIINAGTFTTLSALTLNNATVTATGGASSSYQAFKLRDSVTATGNAVINSNNSSNSYNQIHLGANAIDSYTTFDVVGPTDTLTISTVLRNGVTGQSGAVVKTGLVKTGEGTMELTRPALFTGALVIQQGKLTLSDTAALAASIIDVRAGTTLDASAVPFSYLAVGSATTLTGSGAVIGDLDLAGKIAPGDAVGSAELQGQLNMLDGGGIICQLAEWDSPSNAGVTHDVVNVDAADFSFVSSSWVFRVTLPQPLGDIHFVEADRDFIVLHAAGALTDFDPQKVVVDATEFASAVGATGKWSLAQSGSNIVLSYRLNTDPFALWIAGFYPGSSNPAVIGFDADRDHDGIANAIEFISGGDPTLADSWDKLPRSTVDGANVVVTFRRSADAAYLNPIIEWSEDLVIWQTAVHGQKGVSISAGPADPDGTPTVLVSIPRPAAGKFFSRLSVTVTP